MCYKRLGNGNVWSEKTIWQKNRIRIRSDDLTVTDRSTESMRANSYRLAIEIKLGMRWMVSTGMWLEEMLFKNWLKWL